MYQFWARQGQTDQVVRVLRDLGLQPLVTRNHVGLRGNYHGCGDPQCCEQRVRRADVVWAHLPAHISKGYVDRALVRAGVPGARLP